MSAIVPRPTMLEAWCYPHPPKVYRYELARIWDQSKPRGIIIGLNPSTADAIDNDHTITKEIHFGQEWGWGGFLKLNLFGFRATHPKDLWAASDPVGPENDTRIALAVKAIMVPPGGWSPANDWTPAAVVCAWGAFTHPRARRRVQEILCGPLRDVPLSTIGPLTKRGQPPHPLMLPYGRRLQEWRPFA